ncbi:PREDICTED: torsin-1A-like [Dufourea novaeangliae]|uniref:Torsin-like protein n=1 Tax=Dufourea novaeangliae TaxID=178035 RepID=A0A154PN58_DUFNO|nr:PREDICTED: torsin-1A-like [Dufourea novaeangliae]KZC13282.1 Torsin-like protein [Dufourea novaeangliae]
MNFVCFLSIYILVSLTTIRAKWTDTFSSLYSGISSSISYVPCKFTECCNDDYISPNIDKLDDLFNTEVFGQQIAHRVIINALRGHLTWSDPPKALAMSFHGPPGTGKTYVAQMIAKSFYKQGQQSNFYHCFNGRNDFPLQQDVELYKEELRKVITESLKKCERSIFVFDEVDKMPEGLLNVLVPFLDYNTRLKTLRLYGTSLNTRKAVYIFLSNTGSTRIIQRLLALWEKGEHRSKTQLEDFEHLISVGAFNEKGGLHHSDTIHTSLIDHYVPFLPLEEAHVKKCINKSFTNRNVLPTENMIQEALSYVMFGPSPHNLYAIAGCKRVEQKVAAIIYSQRKQTENNEL